MRKRRLGKDEKREVTPEFVNMSKEILYPQIQGVTTSIFGFGSEPQCEEAQRTRRLAQNRRYVQESFGTIA
jgi:hypothetical protein